MKLDIHPVQRDSNSRVHLICTVGTKWLTCVVMDYPIKLVQLHVNDHNLIELIWQGKPYPVDRALKQFRRMAKDHGITEGAKDALNDLG